MYVSKKTGGIALIAVEGWKDKLPILGVISSFGYWMGWSAVLAIAGVSAGEMISQQWLKGLSFELDIWGFSVGLPQIIAILLMVIFGLINRVSLSLAAKTSKILGLFLLLPIVLISIAPLISNDWSAERLMSNFDPKLYTTLDGLKVLAIWLFLVCWSSYSTEMSASFAAEYKTIKDMKLAVLSSSFYTTIVFLLVGLGIGGLVDAEVALKDPNSFYIGVFAQLTNEQWAPLFSTALIFALCMGLNAGLADGSRALYTMSVEGLTIKQLSKLNKYSIPERCILVAIVMNIMMVIFLQSPLAILVAANMGYVICVICALTGYYFLKKSKVEHSDEFVMSDRWLPFVLIIAFYTFVILCVGLTFIEEAGYGSTKELLIGSGILMVSVLLYWVRKYIQK